MESKVDALGPTGRRVAERLGEIRREQNLTQGQLSQRLTALGRPIAVAALSKIEKGSRRVDTDDLLALALALDVTPNELLLAATARRGEPVQLTPAKSMETIEAWRWATYDPDEDGRGVFISYAHQDEQWAHWIAWQLEEAGLPVEVEPWTFTPGTDWVSEIHRSIRSARCFLAVLSEAYISSQWTRREWTLATEDAGQRRRLLPLRIEDFEIPMQFARYQYVDLVARSSEQASDDLLRAVRGFVPARRTTPPVRPEFPGTSS
ncbi:TIR domain-containing protein [Streptomyces sp. NPDC017940]|uniref:TIR domain-containing protein n=1 Tax=Streptomyces sp. NPDC017940 TaxID=3365017 RepID=UPI00379F3152